MDSRCRNQAAAKAVRLFCYRTVCYRKKGGKKTAAKVVFYLKESVEIPARKFFFLSDEEINQLKEELGNDLL